MWRHHSRLEISSTSEEINFYHWRSAEAFSNPRGVYADFVIDFYQNPNLPQVHRNRNVQVVLQEVDQYAEAVVEAEAPPEVRQEVGEALLIEVEGELGEEASVLGEGIEGVILILQGLALAGEEHSLSGLASWQSAFCVREISKMNFSQCNISCRTKTFMPKRIRMDRCIINKV